MLPPAEWEGERKRREMLFSAFKSASNFNNILKLRGEAQSVGRWYYCITIYVIKMADLISDDILPLPLRTELQLYKTTIMESIKFRLSKTIKALSDTVLTKKYRFRASTNNSLQVNLLSIDSIAFFIDL